MSDARWVREERTGAYELDLEHFFIRVWCDPDDRKWEWHLVARDGDQVCSGGGCAASDDAKAEAIHEGILWLGRIQDKLRKAKEG